MYYHAELTPGEIHFPASQAEFQTPNRHWQGIASMEVSRGGRLFATFYSGGVTEQNGNFVVLSASDDGGRSWVDPLLAVRHADGEMRVFDPNVWMDPRGRLWLTWAQSHDYFDGRDGVWASVLDDPDAPLGELRFSEPRRIANGVMMCKPTVLSDGTWLFPCAVWACMEPSEKHPEVERERRSNVYASTDEGASFSLRGGADVPNRHFDEHMVVERRDGSLWMLVRRFDGIGEAVSYDKGFTWWQERHAGLAGPDSRFFIRRLHSGNLLLVNHADFRGRNNLTAFLSFDDGKSWQGGLLLDGRGNVSYPDGAQGDDGTIYIAYDFERYGAREVLMAVFAEQDVLAGLCVSDRARLAVPVSRAAGQPPR